MDAATRVAKLRLQRGQQADAARVLLECCGQEGVFNLFYALLGARLCGAHRELKFGLQCAYWDEFKQLEGASLHRAANLAKLLAQLLGRAALPLAALRVVPWGSLEPRAVFFWQVCFTEVLQLDPVHQPHLYDQVQLAPHLLDLVANRLQGGVVEGLGIEEQVLQYHVHLALRLRLEVLQALLPARLEEHADQVLQRELVLNLVLALGEPTERSLELPLVPASELAQVSLRDGVVLVGVPQRLAGAEEKKRYPHNC